LNFEGILQSNYFMFRSLQIFVLISFCLGSCGSPGTSKLSDALAKAVKEKKISEKKVESIMKEYELLRDRDKTIARKFADQILTAIQMGGDSSHIDAVRRSVAAKDGKIKV